MFSIYGISHFSGFLFRTAFLVLVLSGWMTADAVSADITKDMNFFGGIQDRSMGSKGSEAAAEYILKAFQEAGLKDVGSQEFLAPIPEVSSASIEVNGETLDIHPWEPNLVYLSMTPKEGLRGRLVYANEGSFEQLSGKPVEGSIVLLEMSSHGNWLNAASLGAGAVLFLGDESSGRSLFMDKSTQTPIALPRYWVPPESARKLRSLAREGSPEAVVKSVTGWKNRLVKNCYGFVPGRDPELSKELVIIDASYDASSHVLGLAPGADEATSIVMLLALTRQFTRAPPDRTVLFMATVGNGHGHAGMRQFMFAFRAKKKALKKEADRLKKRKNLADDQLEILEKENPLDTRDAKELELIRQILVEKAKDKADFLTREIQYRKTLSEEEAGDEIEDPRPYRQFSWISDMRTMTPEHRATAVKLLNDAIADRQFAHKELKRRIAAMRSSASLREILEQYEHVLSVNLHLSSHSMDVGVLESGDTYPLRANLKRVARATRLIHLMLQASEEVSKETGQPGIIRDLSRGFSPEEGAGKSYAKTYPASDVSALAGLPAVSLMTLDDYRARWSTPHDTLDHVNMKNIERMASFLPSFTGRLASHRGLRGAMEAPIAGMANLEGQAMFIRQGELFPDQPATGTIVPVIQGDSVFRSVVFQDGSFLVPGLANRRVSLEKLIIEPFKLDAKTGRVAWAADKVRTGKENYRVSVKRDTANASLVMFQCRQTDVLPVFNPQNMGYLTKVELLDAVTEATPLRYWYSRVDGRNTMAVSIFLERGTRFKLIMAESLLTKDFLLLNGTKEQTTGKGFLIEDPPTIYLTPHRVAKDLHLLVGERLNNLSNHGITNVYLERLYEHSGLELASAGKYLEVGRYDRFWSTIIPAWAKLDVVYSEVEKTQRDVLAGVMFFVALFVPFAYCVERYLFSFRGIYQQIVAFFLILVMTIFTIRALHPAFQLTYSPMVVIIAFFIVGLSLLVSWIIFMKFETEMSDLHMRSSHLMTPQASKWQAFGAGFSIGVSNLNRRKLRTALTCTTLIILTFTVMSFTNVKSLRRTALTRIADDAPYQGILLRHQVRLPLTLLTLEDMKARFPGHEATIWPRAWIDPISPTDRTLTRISRAEGSSPLEGILGVGHDPPEYFEKLVTHGRWFGPDEDDSILLPTAMAPRLGLDPEKDVGADVYIMGARFKVAGYFDASLMQSLGDLDQVPIAPAYFEVGPGEELSEVEIEAMQAGEELLPQAERFRYASAVRTVIIPLETCLQYGGTLKTISILPHSKPVEIADELSSWLAFPLFVGEDGTWFHSASTTLRYQGVANLIVPILIVIFITLNTMIGHVHERQREISTYTSVGLAPTHVGFLFIVEALSLAVLSTVIGYILAQLSAKFLGNTPLFSQLTFNYSSMASVACMFLVFSVVFLAALYPARVAAEMAMPDVNRSWTLPDPVKDTVYMNLPFLLKGEEETGIMNFLNAFYKAHQDVAHGAFIVDETYMDADEPHVRPGQMPMPVCLLLRTNVWLAPFDFGIKQRLQLHCCPSEDNPGYLEISLAMTRLSGERSAWIRANKNFIKALRKQMLLWRLLDADTKSVFAQGDPSRAAAL